MLPRQAAPAAKAVDHTCDRDDHPTLATGVLPRWIGWLFYGVAALNLAAIPSIYGGTDHRGFYTAPGWGVAVIATFPRLIWFLVVSIVMIWKRAR